MTKLLWMDFLIQLIATLIGVGLGFWLPIIWSKREEKRKTKEIKQNMIDSIKDELQDIQKGLNNPDSDFSKVKWNDKTRGFEGNYSTISVSTIDASLHSGTFMLLPLDLQASVDSVHSRIEYYNFFIKKALTFYDTPIYATGKGENEANYLINTMRGQIVLLKKEIDLSLEQLNKSIE
ncbi:MAG: hypothetical protein ACREA1_00245 [Nitrosotalea sp.]